MAKLKSASKAEWRPYHKIHKQICRFSPGDERPAPSRDMSINGPMLRLALTNGKRGWISRRGLAGGSASMGTIANLVAVGMVDQCRAYVDFEIDDGDGSDERFCLWTLWHSSLDLPTLEFIGPTYRELQAMWAREVETRKIASAATRPAASQRTSEGRRKAL